MTKRGEKASYGGNGNFNNGERGDQREKSVDEGGPISKRRRRDGSRSV